MSVAARTLREARIRSGMTQASLARKLGTTQSAVARLESRGSNPRLSTLDRALRATGHRLALSTPPAPPGLDETLIEEGLRMSPEERLAAFEDEYRKMRDLLTNVKLVGPSAP